MPNKIDKPGVYAEDIHRDEYHQDPVAEISLSRSIALKLVDRSPLHAWYDHPRLNANYEYETDDKYSLGTAAHRVILGKGQELAVCGESDWRKADAKLFKQTALDQGHIPLLPSQYETVMNAFASIQPQLADLGLADAVFSKKHGTSEAVVVSHDPTAGYMRMMADRLLPSGAILDIKFTGVEVSAATLAKHCAQMQYEFQQAFYERVIGNLYEELRGNLDFTFIFIENKPPFAVMPVKLPADALNKGRAKVAEACTIWARCKRQKEWPSFSKLGVQRLEYPAWSTAEYVDAEADQ